MTPPDGQGNPLSFAQRECVALGHAMAGRLAYKAYAMWSDRFDRKAVPQADIMAQAISQGFTGWDAPGDHPAGFAILHLANDGIYLLLTRWNNANNLRHRVFSVLLAPEGSISLTPLADPFTIACVWETRLINIEATIWIEEVLAAPSLTLSADMLDRYLSRQFEGKL
jgi:hypothetical protein